MAEYENTREELTMHSNSKTQALTVKVSGDAGMASHIRQHQIFILFHMFANYTLQQLS
jgi:hypothetical protein